MTSRAPEHTRLDTVIKGFIYSLGHPCGHNEPVVTRILSNLKGETGCWWICGREGFAEGKNTDVFGDTCEDWVSILGFT